MLIDTHAHIQLHGFKDDADEVMQRSLDASMVIVNVGTQLDTSTEAVAMLEKYPERVYAVVGLHPGHTYEAQLDEQESGGMVPAEAFDYEAYKQLAFHNRVVGIGECGLDYYRLPDVSSIPLLNKAFGSEAQARREGLGEVKKIKEKQRAAFFQQLRLAQELDKALVIHCRPSKGTGDAYLDILHILEEAKNMSPELRFEIHSFTGDLETAQKFIALGGYIGLNGIITFDKTGMLEVVAKGIPLEFIVLETDAPYLAPAPHRGKRNEPLYVEFVARKIAEWKNVSYEKVCDTTTINAKELFKI